MAGAPVAGTGPDRSERPEGRPVRRAPATPPRVAVAGDRLWLARRVGEIRPGGVEGFYAGDTRLLSRLEWRSTVREGEGRLRRRSRLRLDDDGALLELRWRAEARGPLTALVELALEGDFADLMEVRGFVEPRPRTPETAADRASGRIRWRHAGADGVERWLEIELDPVPGEMDTCSAVWRFRLAAGEEARIRCRLRPGRRPPLGLPCSRRRSAPPPGTGRADRRLAWEAGGARVEFEPAAAGGAGGIGGAGDASAWERVLRRSERDLEALSLDLGAGPTVAAGAPWFATLFGRDALLTAFELLPFRPSLARATLETLAAWQGRREETWREEEPGRIPHELRFGEATGTGRLPYGRYYGSIDATPLFVWLAAATWRRTGDRPWLERIRPAVERALAWVERARARDPEGFLSFEPHAGRHGAEGLRTQAWKDSADSMVDERGRPVEPPLAVVEVQGYVVAALRAWAEVLAELGEEGRAAGLRREADRLAERIEARFWLPREGSYALALGARRGAARRRAGAVTSDAAHLLWAGVAAPERAAALARRLLAPDLFTGWGLRTLSAANPAYHPLAYHRGAVWPHDTAVAVAGLARYGHLREAYDLAAALLDAGAALPRHRLPECFSGAERPPATPPAGDRNGGAAGGRPEEYPAACRPQAWAAGAPFLVVAALAGLELDAVRGRIRLRPFLGGGEGERALAAVRLRGLAVGGQRLDLEIRRLAGRELEVRLRRLGARRSEERRRLEEGAETFFALRA
ncbi:MAG: glycogen debranching N-terminal domain-containing protein [Bacillota bacterium]|nr:glycogen debranching N-terminal domain-containing protein [Bacillota bacterium]